MQPELIVTTDEGMMGALSNVAHRLHLPTTLVKFLIVGGVAALINQTWLYLLYDSPVFWFLPDKDTRADLWLFTHPDIRLLIASVLAVEIAILFQFNAHERWTFRRRAQSGWIGYRFVKFNLSSIVSPIISVATINVLKVEFDVSPYIANPIGILIGFTWNWTLNTLVIWPREENAREIDEAAATDRLDLLGTAYRFARGQLETHATFVKFSLAGMVGYVLYQATLFAAYDLADVRLFAATIIAAEVSITGGFFVRDMWVFTDAPVVRRSFWARFSQYQAKSLVSTLLIVSATVNILTSGFDITHFISTPIGVALGFAWNWSWERSFIWRRAQIDS